MDAAHPGRCPHHRRRPRRGTARRGDRRRLHRLRDRPHRPHPRPRRHDHRRQPHPAPPLPRPRARRGRSGTCTTTTASVSASASASAWLDGWLAGWLAGWSEDSRGVTVSLDDGETVQADHGAHAVVGVGTVPRTEWLWHAGLDLTDGVLCGPDHPPHGRGRLRARLHRRGDPAERRTVAGYVRPGPDSAPILVGAVAPDSPLPPPPCTPCSTTTTGSAAFGPDAGAPPSRMSRPASYVAPMTWSAPCATARRGGESASGCPGTAWCPATGAYTVWARVRWW